MILDLKSGYFRIRKFSLPNNLELFPSYVMVYVIPEQHIRTSNGVEVFSEYSKSIPMHPTP